MADVILVFPKIFCDSTFTRLATFMSNASTCVLLSCAAVQRLLHQNTPVTPNLWQQFKDFFQTTPINQTRFANATFMIFYNITSGHPGGRQNRTFWLNTTRTIVHVQTESPVVSKSASEGSQYTPTNLPSTTTGSDSTAEGKSSFNVLL